WHRVYAVNLHSTFYLARAIAPGMIERKRGGSIVVIGGMGVLTSLGPDNAATTSSKAGAYGLVKSLAQALGPHGIRANIIAPGTIDSERVNPQWYPGGDAQTNTVRDKTALRRFGTLREVADVALFLASDESSYVTGDRINCSGG